MADFVFNRAKGRVTQFAELINGNASPYANAAFIVELINTSATDATLKDLDTFADIEADASTAELTSGTNANYARKTVTEAASAITVTYDDTNDRADIDIPDQTWTALGAGTAVTDLIIGFDNDTTGGADSAIVPCTQHDFPVTPDGSDISATINVFYRAS